eukprot:ANDGO_04012.mRNA.1 UPF0118 membrane protein aq_740
MVLEKDEVQRALRTFMASFLPLLLGFSVFAIWVGLGSYVTPCIFGIATSLALYEPYELTLSCLRWFDRKCATGFEASGLDLFSFCTLATVVLSIAVYWLTALFSFPAALGIVSISTLSLFYMWQVDRPFIAAVIVVMFFALILAGIAVALGFVVYGEIVVFKDFITDKVSTNDVQRFLKDPRRSPIVDSALVFVERTLNVTSVEVLVVLEEYKKSFGNVLVAKSDVIVQKGMTVALDLYDLTFSLFLFLPTLHLSLQYKDKVIEVLYTLSPLTRSDTTDLMNYVQNSLAQMFLVYFMLGFSHGIATFLTFRFGGLHHVYILSIIAGVLATIPVFSSWIIWAPACFYLFLESQYVSAVVMLVVQVIVMSWLDNYLYGTMGGLPFLLSISIYLSLWAWGLVGIIVGPLVLTLLPFLYDRIDAYMNLPKKKQPPHVHFVSSGRLFSTAGSPTQHGEDMSTENEHFIHEVHAHQGARSPEEPLRTPLRSSLRAVIKSPPEKHRYNTRTKSPAKRSFSNTVPKSYVL